MKPNLSAVLLGVFISLILNVGNAGDLDWDCDPRAQCRRCIFGACADEPICVAVRATCRKKCGPINDDANRYIAEYRRTISDREGALAINAANLARKNSQITGNSSMINDIKNGREQLSLLFQTDLRSEESTNAFLGKLREVLKVSLSQGVENAIVFSQLQLSPSDARVMEVTLKAYKSNLQELYELLALVPDSTNGLNVYALVDKILEKQLQSQMVQSSLLQAEKASIESDIASGQSQIASLQQSIREQEARKCPSSLF